MFDEQAATRLAARALGHWPADRQLPQLIDHRENSVFKVSMRDGNCAVLRIHRPGYHAEPALLGELSWLRYLNGAGLHVPGAIANNDDRLLVSEQSDDGRVRHVSLLSWVDGEELGQFGEALSMPTAQQITIFHSLGDQLARLHDLSDAWQRPAGFVRHAWDLDGLVGESPFWGPFWDNHLVTGERRQLLLRMREAGRSALQGYRAAGGDYGLIHADLVRENVFVHQDGVRFIDFDDGGFGWRLFDIATVLYKNRHEPAFAQLRDAFLDGYTNRRPLRQIDMDHLMLFVALRSCTYVGWVAARVEHAEYGEQYVEWACEQAEKFFNAPAPMR